MAGVLTPDNMEEQHKQVFMATLERMQARDSVRLYNALVERCFKDCVVDFRSKTLDSAEEKCVTKCCEKFLNLSTRAGMRFQEFFSEVEQQMAQSQR